MLHTFLKLMFNFFDPIFSQLSSIVSQSALGAGQLSQVLDPPSTEPSSQEKPISAEVTDAFTTAENVSFILDICWSIFLQLLDLPGFPTVI